MDNDARNWSTLAHLGGAINAFFLPSFGWLTPGVVYLLHKDKPDVAKHASEALQFQLAMSVGMWLVALAGGFFCFLFSPLFAAIGGLMWIALLGYSGYAALQVSRGEHFQYPLLGDELPR